MKQLHVYGSLLFLLVAGLGVVVHFQGRHIDRLEEEMLTRLLKTNQLLVKQSDNTALAIQNIDAVMAHQRQLRTDFEFTTEVQGKFNQWTRKALAGPDARPKGWTKGILVLPNGDTFGGFPHDADLPYFIATWRKDK